MAMLNNQRVRDVKRGVLPFCWKPPKPPHVHSPHLLQMLTKSDNLWQAGKIKAIDFYNQRRLTSDQRPTWKDWKAVARIDDA